MNTSNDITQWLQENGNQTEPALILAAHQGRGDVLDYLLRQNTDLNVLDNYGNNALWAAFFAESESCIKQLLDAGIDINYQNTTGATALTYSSSTGKHLVVAQLLQAGANPLLTTQDDFSALDLAANLECLRLLKQATSQYKNK